MNILAVGLGGFIGAVLRYLIGLIPVKETMVFPVKTTAAVHAGERRGDHAGAQALWSDLEKDGANEYQSIFCRLLWNYRA